MGRAAGARLVGVPVVLSAAAGCGLDDGSTVVPTPAPQDRTTVVPELARAAQAQNLCYGWQLAGSTGLPISAGSSLGDAVAVDSDPTRCPRWLEVSAQVVYTPQTSEANDSASLSIRQSPRMLAVTGLLSDLSRLGVTEDALIDDPAETISRAALALRLLATQAGVAPPVPPPSTRPGASTATPEPPASRVGGPEPARVEDGHRTAPEEGA